ncbi:hypothetical protein GCM10017562_58250 [Streptomyces roseofulvus]
MGESVTVRCPECRRSHAYAAPAFPCPCGSPVAPRLTPDSTAEPVRRRNWLDEWVTVRCRACGREDQWPHPELGCACGAVLRVPVAPPTEDENRQRTEPGAAAAGTATGTATGQAPGPTTGPENGPVAGMGSGPGSGTATGPWVGPETGAATRSASGRATGPEAVPEPWPATGAETGPTAGLGIGPGAGPGAGPGTRTESGPEIPPGSGLEPGPESRSGTRPESGPEIPAGSGLENGQEVGPGNGAEIAPGSGPEPGPATGTTTGPATGADDGAGEGYGSESRRSRAYDPGDSAGTGSGAGPARPLAARDDDVETGRRRPAGPVSDWFGNPPRSFAERYPERVPLQPTAPRSAAARDAFRPVTIRTARDAVAAAATYLHWLGFRDIVQPEDRHSAGVDLRGTGLVAQVDPSTRPAGLRAVECLWLNGLSASAVSVFFSLAGYTPEARSRAAEIRLPLFVLDLTGTPQPVNDAADELTSGGAV